MARSEIEVLSDGVAALRASVDGLTKEIQEQSAFAKRSRTLILRQWIPIVAVIVLTLALGALAYGARHTAQVAKAAATTAQKNAENAYAACVKANVSRATTRDLWNTIFTFPPVQTLTPAEQAARNSQVAALRARIATSYADQDCSKLAP